MSNINEIKNYSGLKTHDIKPTVEFHAQNTQTSISFYQMMINDLKSFLVADPARTNKYVIYDVMPRLDPELGVALQIGISWRSKIVRS